ncbi:MAG: hypothetical protein FK734_19850 [Asgard group archaeon]|nr:hypothetical protein [Asgard group archaeon]
MSYCEIDEHYNLKQIKEKNVLDVENNPIGFVHDIVFDTNLNLIAFILKSSPFDELKRKLKEKKELELVVPIEDVKSIHGDIVLNINKSQLKDYLDKDVIPKGSYLYNELKNTEIIDSNDKKVGTIGGLIFLPCREVSFLVRGSLLDKIATTLGLVDEWDLLLTVDHISAIAGKKMKMDITKEQMETALNRKHLGVQDAKKYLDSRKTESTTEIHLLARRYG